ncbi:MAG: hypothetical protein EBW54_06980 [Betaproteobacteria bacterium]|nr:hypothetical protein [Betaproteobacteria bacterium]
MGVEAICIREAGDLASEFSRAFGKPGPNLIDVHISSGYE